MEKVLFKMDTRATALPDDKILNLWHCSTGIATSDMDIGKIKAEIYRVQAERVKKFHAVFNNFCKDKLGKELVAVIY